MAVKAVEMVRKIRDQQYELSKNLPIDEQIRYINEKSVQLQEILRERKVSTTDDTP